MRRILSISIKALFISTLLLSLFESYEVNNVLHPPRIVPTGNTLRKFGVPYQSVDLLTSDGVHLAAWYTPPRKSAIILLAHGYGGDRPEWVYEMLARKGYGVLAWDARAHGQSGGEISTIGYLEVLDVQAALDFALAQPGANRIGAWGGSMGAATLILASAQFPQIEALFVDSSFASLDDEFNFLVPYPILNPLAKILTSIEGGIPIEKVSPLNVISQISPRPVYIVHGTGDTVAPPGAGQQLYDAAHEPRFLWVEKGETHLHIYYDYPRRYKKRLLDFFDVWLLGSNSETVTLKVTVSSL